MCTTKQLVRKRKRCHPATKSCAGRSTEVLVEFDDVGRHELIINGIDASFTGRSARIFTDRTFNEVYIDGGLEYFSNALKPADVDSTESSISSGKVKSLQVFEIKSIYDGGLESSAK